MPTSPAVLSGEHRWRAMLCTRRGWRRYPGYESSAIERTARGPCCQSVRTPVVRSLTGAAMMHQWHSSPREAVARDEKMTDSLKAYLQGDFLKERQEVERIDQIVEEVWPLFLAFAFFDSPDAKDRAGAEIAAGWPYEIKDGDDPKAPEAKKFSYSTNAMILFLIGVVLETVEPGVLVPEVSISKPESKDKQSSQEILRNGLTQIAQRSNDRKAPAGSLFKSNSFGLDDPFTITWLLELLTNKSSPMGWEENEDVQQFKSRLFAVASDRLKSISKSTHPLLHWGNDLNKERRSANHMFPLLRYVQISRLLDRSANEGGSSNPEQNLAGNLLERFHNRMHYHIAQEVITTGAFDAAELAFATEGILLSKNDPQALEPDVLNRVF